MVRCGLTNLDRTYGDHSDLLDRGAVRKMTLIRKYLGVILAIVSLAGGVASAIAADAHSRAVHSLDGLRFQGVTGEKGKGDHHADTITFKNGVFRSLDCENWGFGAGPYTVEKNGDAYHFRSTLMSPNRGKLEWTGKIVGDKASATFRWRHERWYWTIDREYWFEGTRQAGKP